MTTLTVTPLGGETMDVGEDVIRQLHCDDGRGNHVALIGQNEDGSHYMVNALAADWDRVKHLSEYGD